MKKLKDANTAYRGRVRLGFYSHKETELVADLGSTDPNATVENSTKTGGNTIQLGVGLEKRIGSTRVVGVYGADVNLGIAGQKKSYEYGNSLDNTGSRITSEKQGGAFMVGLNAFAGVEWFVAPKVSLGAEYSWGLMLASKGFNTTSWDRATGDNGAGEIESGTKENDFGIDTNNNGLSINMNFYFQ